MLYDISGLKRLPPLITFVVIKYSRNYSRISLDKDIIKYNVFISIYYDIKIIWYKQNYV